jgi:transcriptional regulator with XRE-family HTH domain
MPKIRELMPMQWVQRLREKHKMTVYGLARMVGTTPQRIHKLESTAQGCKIDVLCALRKAFNLSWDQLGRILEEEASAVIPRPYKPKKKKLE